MTSRVLLLLAFFLLFSESLIPIQIFAQNIFIFKEQKSPETFRGIVINDVKHISTSPFHLNKKNTAILILLAGFTSATINFLDHPIQNRVTSANQKSSFRSTLAWLSGPGYVYNDLSSVVVMAGLSSSMLTGAWLCKDKKLMKTGRLLVEAYLFTAAISFLIKGVFNRSRPYTGNGPFDFHYLKFTNDVALRALPSGHASGAFAMMTVIASQYKRWWVKIPAYSLAASVALQRIDDNKHWSSDVLLGGMLGYSVGRSLVSHNREREKQIEVKPILEFGNVGISLQF